MFSYLTEWRCRNGEEKHEAAVAQELVIHGGPWSPGATRVSASLIGVTSPVTTPPVRLECHSDAVIFTSTRPGWGLGAFTPPGSRAKVGRSWTLVTGVEWFVGDESKRPPALPSRPLCVASLFKPVPGLSVRLSSSVHNFHHLCLGSCNKCVKGTPKCGKWVFVPSRWRASRVTVDGLDPENLQGGGDWLVRGVSRLRFTYNNRYYWSVFFFSLLSSFG